jgi:hypothetical protein
MTKLVLIYLKKKKTNKKTNKEKKKKKKKKRRRYISNWSNIFEASIYNYLREWSKQSPVTGAININTDNIYIFVYVDYFGSYTVICM